MGLAVVGSTSDTLANIFGIGHSLAIIGDAEYVSSLRRPKMMRHNADMEHDDIPGGDVTRLTDTGDIEVFDGVSWRMVAPLSDDLGIGHRPAGGPVAIPHRELLADAPTPLVQGDESR
jgi:hypothetical protein